MGTPPECVEKLVRAHVPDPGSRRFLDLGCGKGAVAVKMAQAFGAEVLGLDLMAAFIETARAKAKEHGVSALCRLRVEDVNTAVEIERDFDCVILGAVGHALGSPEETLKKLMRTIKPGGYVFIEDAFLASSDAMVRYAPYEYPTRGQWLRIFADCGVELMEEVVADAEDQSEGNEDDLNHIEKRAGELAALHPEKKSLFEGYVISQKKEIDDLEDAVVGAAWLLRKNS